MIQIYNALVLESHQGSLTDLTSTIKTNIKDVRLSVCHHLSQDMHEDIDFAFVEITTEKDLVVLQNILNHKIKVIAVLFQTECLKSVLSYDVTAFIVSPFEVALITKAIDKTKAYLNMEIMGLRMDSVLHLQQPKRSSTIIIPTGEGFEVIRINDIIQVQADRAYCILYLLNGRKMIVSKPLREIEEMLPQDVFFRSHISHLVNVNSVICYRKEDGGAIVLSDGSKVPVAKKRKDELMEVLSVA
jgi:two-component system, LytTR family, response regulator